MHPIPSTLLTAIVSAPVGTEIPSLAEAGYEELHERRPDGYVRRLFTILRHFLGLAAGGLVASVRDRPAARRRGLRFHLERLAAMLVQPLVKRSLTRLPFPVQLRRRLELLGPSFIKLGQILSLRDDLLPREVTLELRNLLDRLPAVPYLRFLELVESELGAPVDEIFAWIEPTPAGSASIAQIHLATTIEGDRVILKVVKPGIRESLERDARLLRILGFLLEAMLSQYQPRRVIREFTEYTLREVDLELEADNAETFAANFADLPEIRFPRIFRRYSGRRVLCMEYFDGDRPDSAAVRALGEEERQQIVELGAAAIIRMLYRDGFFHADLHPANLIILPGPQAAFIDLGMVGRLDERLRRTLLYYYYSLLSGDAATAARYLTGIADRGPGSDPEGFRRAVEEVGRRWRLAPHFEGFSLAHLIAESVALGGKYRMVFPVEMVLMVKALVTFEGLGNLLAPGFDVANVSRPHVMRILIHQWAPWSLARESLRGAPELVDALVRAPLMVTEGLRFLEQTVRRRDENPFAGLRGTLFGGFCMLAASVLAARALPLDDFGPQTLAIAAALFLIGLIAAFGKAR